MNRKMEETILATGMGILGIVFFIAFAGVDAYMFGLQPPSWAQAIDQSWLLSPLGIDLLGTLFFVMMILLFLIERPKPRRRKK